MSEQTTVGRELAKGAGRMAIHLLALAAGLVLMIAGIAMGVTVVMLPVGVPVGFFGLFVFLWGLFGRSEGAKGVVQPPNRQ